LPKAIFHCFSGTVEEANKIIALGNFKLGIGGVVTFKNSGLDKVVEQIDVQHLVLETDAPYLAPVPFRGKRNEPAYILEVAKKIATIKGVSLQELAEVSSKNADFIYKKV
jgi:TatD DNase family protein